MTVSEYEERFKQPGRGGRGLAARGRVPRRHSNGK
jgi:hypothetical protein